MTVTYGVGVRTTNCNVKMNIRKFEIIDGLKRIQVRFNSIAMVLVITGEFVGL